jgi:polysaccharide chain length determinant protein (PEP-CTERM system associated)
VIPGKKYRPEDFLAMAWRRRWFLVVPLVVAAVGTFFYAQTLPNRYRSQATVIVIRPQVPENLVRSTITQTLQERLEYMRQQILSRARLERMIEEFDLYPEERRRLLMDQVVEMMRRDIRVEVPRVGRRQAPGSFTVGYESEDSRAAVLVAERVASLFVRENLEGRSMQTDATTQFLQSQVDEAARQLQEHEARLETFRRANAGRLPDEVGTNLQVMQNTRQQLQALHDSVNRDRDRQMTIERLIADELAIAAATPVASTSASGTEAAARPAAQQLEAARAALAALMLRLTDDHPDLRAAVRRVSELEEQAAAEALQQPLSEGAPVAAVTVLSPDRQRRVAALRAEHESLERGIQLARTKIDQAQAGLGEYQRRIEQAPMLESQLAALMREYETLRQTHDTLLKKTQDARLAASLEHRQVGEQFRIIDPARRPDRPTGPDRVRMNLIGALMGLGFGLAIAALLEYKDTALRSEDDVIAALSLPVLALVPTMLTDDERRRIRRRKWLLAGSAAATLVVGVAAVAWRLRLFDFWIG